MFVLIVGCGRVGSAIAKRMIRQGHEVSVLDENQEAHALLEHDMDQTWEDAGGQFTVGTALEVEALNEAGLTDELWQPLEALIKERVTLNDPEQMAKRVGLNQVSSHTEKAAFEFADGDEFLDSPLINDTFLADWMAIVPEARQPEVRERIVATIERDLHDGPFEVTIKATLITGIK